jgi:hypothetical protein
MHAATSSGRQAACRPLGGQNRIAPPRAARMRPCQRRSLAVCAQSFDGKRCVVIGGTGRVGGSSASALLSAFPGLKVTLASRYRATYDAAVARRPELGSMEFVNVDIGDKAAVKVGGCAC